MRLSPGVRISRAAHVTPASAAMSSALRALGGGLGAAGEWRSNQVWREKRGKRREGKGGGMGCCRLGDSESITEEQQQQQHHPIAFSSEKKKTAALVKYWTRFIIKHNQCGVLRRHAAGEQAESRGKLGGKQADSPGPRTATMAPMVEEGAQIGESNYLKTQTRCASLILPSCGRAGASLFRGNPSQSVVRLDVACLCSADGKYNKCENCGKLTINTWKGY